MDNSPTELEFRVAVGRARFVVTFYFVLVVIDIFFGYKVKYPVDVDAYAHELWF